MATLYSTDGTAKTVKPQHGKTFTLEELQTFVGGYVEEVSPNIFLVVGKTMFVNEDGLSKALPVNRRAMGLCRGSIVGPALVCAPDEVE